MSSRYRSYADTGPAWATSVPSHWEVKPLLAVGTERKNKNSGMRESNLLSLSFGRIIRKDIDTLGGLLPESFETYQIVEPDDIVFRFTDLQNDKRSLRSARVHERGIITSAYMAFSPTRILPRYFEYLMRGYDVSKAFYGMGGGLRQSLKYEDVRRMPVLVPLVPEQRLIADYLDRETAKIDALIEKQHRMVELLRERLTSVISRWCSPPHAPWVGLNLVTAGIKDGTHGTFVRVDPTQGLPLLSAKNIQGGLVVESPDESYVSHADHEAITASGYPKQGDVLLVIIGATIGKSAIYQARHVAAFQRSVAFLRPGSRIESRFLYYQTRSQRFQEELALRSKTSAQPGIYLGDLAPIQVALPPVTEQRAIVAHLDRETAKIDALIAKAERFVELARERRAALITAAVTGQIDVTRKAG